LADEAVLEQAARGAERRRVSVFVVSRLLVPTLLAALVISGALLFASRGAAIATAGVTLFLLLGLTTLVLNANSADVGEWPALATVAALVQAAFYTAYIIGALFVYVVRAHVLLSGVVAANLFGLLFWTFRRRYLDAAEARREDELGMHGG